MGVQVMHIMIQYKKMMGVQVMHIMIQYKKKTVKKTRIFSQN